MRIHALTSDTAVLGELGQRLARWRLEAGESVQLTNLVRVLRALGLLDALDCRSPVGPFPDPHALQRHVVGRAVHGVDGGHDGAGGASHRRRERVERRRRFGIAQGAGRTGRFDVEPVL
jgi:hypothetical protein